MPLPIESERSRHPFEVAILGACVLIGAMTVLTGEVPKSIGALTGDRYAVVIWGWLLFVGSTLALAGAYWPHRVTALLLSQVGLVALAAALFMYALAIGVATGASGALPVTIVVWFGFNAMRRYWQIQEELNDAIRRGKKEA